VHGHAIQGENMTDLSLALQDAPPLQPEEERFPVEFTARGADYFGSGA